MSKNGHGSPITFQNSSPKELVSFVQATYFPYSYFSHVNVADTHTSHCA